MLKKELSAEALQCAHFVCGSLPSPRAAQTSTEFDADLTSQCADTALHASAIPHEHTHTHLLLSGEVACGQPFHH